MARCEDCNRFVSLENQEPEVLDTQVNGDTVEGQVRIVLACANCGAELKESEEEFSEYIEHECDVPVPEGIEPVEVIEASADPTDRYETKDRNGKPIENPRYQRHYWGAEVSMELKCNGCGETWTQQLTVETQAGGMDDL